MKVVLSCGCLINRTGPLGSGEGLNAVITLG